MARRGENVYKRKDGRWEGRILKSSGKYHYFYAKTYKDIKDKMKAFQENASFYDEKQLHGTRTAGSLFESWLMEDAYCRVKPSTYDSYYTCMNKYVLPFFRKRENQSITNDSVHRFVRTVREDASLAPATKKKIISIFKIALREILKGRPSYPIMLELLKLPQAEEKEVAVFSIKEQRLLEQVALKAKDKRAMGIILCFYTGIRLGELCALRWEDIDTETGIMSVKKTVVRTKNFNTGIRKTSLVIGAAKSRNSIRKIPLPEFILRMAEEYKAALSSYECFVLTGTDVPLDPRSWQKLYKKILFDAKLRDRKFHSIRHTFATRALELGVDIKTLSELLGHSSVSITLNIYAHSLMDQKKAAIRKFNDLHTSSMEQDSFAVPRTVPKALEMR